ncbi:hypothetical protein P7K49_014261 [Saguinus oedipus]|uniref:Uncharacterized protein n=1 Tax=Saguinus oedipus TaxID=9490 RepID=A0ABQ9VIB5_SAGOE|nr:hypothetical protein P7K49_014261 [Saguinus oedipus]
MQPVQADTASHGPGQKGKLWGVSAGIPAPPRASTVTLSLASSAKRREGDTDSLTHSLMTALPLSVTATRWQSPVLRPPSPHSTNLPVHQKQANSPSEAAIFSLAGPTQGRTQGQPGAGPGSEQVWNRRGREVRERREQSQKMLCKGQLNPKELEHLGQLRK